VSKDAALGAPVTIPPEISMKCKAKILAGKCNQNKCSSGAVDSMMAAEVDAVHPVVVASNAAAVAAAAATASFAALGGAPTAGRSLSSTDAETMDLVQTGKDDDDDDEASKRMFLS
jgi:hypothetical protein